MVANDRSIFRVIVIIDAPKQTEKDMEYNAQEYIKMDCENDDLYIETISHINNYDADKDEIESIKIDNKKDTL